MRYGEWQGSMPDTVPARSTSILPAIWRVNSMGEYWEYNTEDDGVVPSTESDVPANDTFTEFWPGALTATARNWAMYWSQEEFNLHALRFRARRDEDNFSAQSRDWAMQMYRPSPVAGLHPAFNLAPPGPEWTMIQFEDEPEPIAIDSTDPPPLLRGLPTVTDIYADFTVAVTGGPFPWRLSRLESPALETWVQARLDGTPASWRYGIKPELGQPSGFDEIATGTSSETVQLHFPVDDDDDEARPFLYRIEPTGTSVETYREVAVTGIHMQASVVWPTWRWVAEDSGTWHVRQRQNPAGNQGSWPLRQRQNAGATGAYSLRARSL